MPRIYPPPDAATCAASYAKRGASETVRLESPTCSLRYAINPKCRSTRPITASPSPLTGSTCFVVLATRRTFSIDLLFLKPHSSACEFRGSYLPKTGSWRGWPARPGRAPTRAIRRRARAAPRACGSARKSRPKANSNRPPATVPAAAFAAVHRLRNARKKRSIPTAWQCRSARPYPGDTRQPRWRCPLFAQAVSNRLRQRHQCLRPRCPPPATPPQSRPLPMAL